MFKTQIEKVKKFIDDHDLEIACGVGVVAGIAATTIWMKPSSTVETIYHEFFVPVYDPNQPIPGLLLSEEAIKREIATGILVVEFLKNKGLSDEFTEFAHKRAAEMVKELGQ